MSRYGMPVALRPAEDNGLFHNLGGAQWSGQGRSGDKAELGWIDYVLLSSVPVFSPLSAAGILTTSRETASPKPGPGRPGVVS